MVKFRKSGFLHLHQQLKLIFLGLRFHKSGIHVHICLLPGNFMEPKEKNNSLPTIFCQTGQRLVLKQMGNKGE